MLHSFLLFLLLVLITLIFPAKIEAVKCHDCVGTNCTGEICEGDYCVSGHYLPKWGFHLEWLETKIVKGCMSGKMLKNDIQSQCETTFHQNGMKKSTCFCNSEDFCNGEKESEKHEIEDIPLFTCICKGEHCKSPKCVGELCSYVLNQKSGEYEQGCVNASMPLIERRFAGSCMIPPATGAMHHWVSKNALDLAFTESCLCAGDNCNSEKPKYDVKKEKMLCDAFIGANIFGTKMSSQNITCTGEYCFTIDIDSQLGLMRSFNTAGCMTFIEGAELAEELNPVGCAKFHSKKLEVRACLNNFTMPFRLPNNDQEEDAKTTRPIFISSTPYYTSSQQPPIDPISDEKSSNTKKVSVFLLIVVFIGLAGIIIYKKQLHKKYFPLYY